MDINQEIGKKYGRLTVTGLAEIIEYFYKWKTHQYKVNCVCECGKTAIVNLNSLRMGRSKSCGCYELEVQKSMHKTHGMCSDGKKISEYNIWSKMKARCNNPKNKNYNDYGARGITVCDEWRSSFQKFYEDMGPRPNKEYSIERINVNGNYCPENCKWIPKNEQTKNTRKNQIEYQGQIKCLIDWCKELKVNYNTIRHRVYDLGMSLEEAIKKPTGAQVIKRSSETIEANSSSKLKIDDVLYIYNSLRPRKELAKMYNVSRGSIDNIKNKTTWGHIHNE